MTAPKPVPIQEAEWLDMIMLKPAHWQWDDYQKARTAILAKIDKLVIEGRIDELERLNQYYIQHDGEGEHKLAAQFDVRIKALKSKLGGE